MSWRKYHICQIMSMAMLYTLCKASSFIINNRYNLDSHHFIHLCSIFTKILDNIKVFAFPKIILLLIVQENKRNFYQVKTTETKDKSLNLSKTKHILKKLILMVKKLKVSKLYNHHKNQKIIKRNNFFKNWIWRGLLKKDHKRMMFFWIYLRNRRNLNLQKLLLLISFSIYSS